MMKDVTPEKTDALLKLIIGTTFCVTVMVMVMLSLYSVVFVTQPMSGMAPADKQFFLLLSDMSKYILGSLATLLAIKGKDVLPPFTPPGLSTEKERSDPPPKPAPAAPVAAADHAPVMRTEPTLEATPVLTGFGGKKAPPPAPEPEI
jgi:hypothetical protein